MLDGRMKLLQLAPDQIVVPPNGESPVAKKDDAILRRSIEVGGVHQPLVVLKEDGVYTLVKGSRRLRAARELGLQTVPVLLDQPPTGEPPARYRQRLRFILSHHRQDLRPSQKAHLIDLLKATFSLNHAQVAAYLGVDADSITNWLAVKHYIPSIAKALDTGRLTMQSARLFDRFNPDGQRAVWKKHHRQLTASKGGQISKSLRRQYSPEQFPDFLSNPEAIKRRVAAARARKGAPKRPRGSLVEQRRTLAKRFAEKETELNQTRADLQAERRPPRRRSRHSARPAAASGSPRPPRAGRGEMARQPQAGPLIRFADSLRCSPAGPPLPFARSGAPLHPLIPHFPIGFRDPPHALFAPHCRGFRRPRCGLAAVPRSHGLRRDGRARSST